MIFQTAKNQQNMGATFTGKKTFFLTPTLIILQLFFFSIGALAVGAFPYPQEIRQPDGSVLTIRQHGDEWYNWTTTADGFRIVRNKKGIYEYATQLKSGKIVASGIKASNPEKRAPSEINFLSSTPKNIGISRENYLKKRSSKYSGILKSSIMNTYFPATGSSNLLLILVNFSDTSPSYLKSSFDDFMNLPGYNGTGSFKDYYEEVSGGSLSITTTVTDWVTVPGKHDYYGPEAKWSEFALHAIQAASEQGVDFSQFDNDGDGVVEGIAIMHQGPGQEVTGNENDIWSHSYSFSSAGIGTSERTFNGVIVDQYTVQPELKSPDGQMNTIGVICHEFGHNLGLPDFYDVNEDTNGQYDGTGHWDIMASGTYNGSPYGSSPAHHNPFSKADLGWVNVTVIEFPQSISLEPVISSKQVLRINSPVENEYLLIENRQKTGFDSFLYSEGMLIYHADGNLIADRRYSNTINIDEHQGFYPIAANHIINDVSCPFPGTANVTELTDTSDPAMTTWSGEGFNRSITEITQVNKTIHFDFMSYQDGSPLTFSALGTDEQSIYLSWTPGVKDNAELPVLIAWNTSNTFGTPVDGTTYNVGDPIERGGTVLYYGNSVQEFIHKNLNASTAYHYSIWSDKGTAFSQSLCSSASTKSAPVSTFPWQDDFESGLQNWRQEFISGTNSWDSVKLSVTEVTVPAYSGNVYASLYQGTTIPKATRLISPVFNLEAGNTYTLKFRHLQPLWTPDQDELRVLIRPLSTGIWQELAHYTNDIREWTARALELPYSEPCEIAFEGISNYGYGIGLDMVEVINSTGCKTKPDIAPANIEASNITKNSADLSWTRGNGDAVIILARKDANIIDLPANGTTYVANAEFGAGDNIGNNTFVLYNGPENQVSLSGLEHTTDYYLQFHEYNENNLCYQPNPAVYKLSTEDVFYDITFEVLDQEANPLSESTVIFEGDTIFTDATGKTTQQVKHCEKFTHVDVIANGYYGKSSRFIPYSSQTITLKLSPFTPLAPASLTATTDYKTVNLQWEPVINENFENYQNYSTNITGWTFEDRDQAPTYGIYTLTWPNEQSPMAYMVIDVYDENLLQMEYNISAWSGSKVLAAFAAQDIQSNDWLISPSFKVKQGDFFSLVARTLANSSDGYTWGNEIIEIKIRSAGESTWTSLSGTDFSVPVSWTRYEYSLADYIGQSVEIAVQNKGKDTFILLLDNIVVGPELGALNTDPTPVFPASSRVSKPPKENSRISNKEYEINRTQKSNTEPTPVFYSGNIEYAIYRDNVEIGHQTGFANTSFSELVDGLSDYEYKVKALYPYSGMESEFSNVVWAETGYMITFEVKDDTGVAIQGASVDFNNTTKTTDENGKVVFTKVPKRTGMEYVISALEFNEYHDTVNTTSNSTISLTMTVASSSIQQESSEQIKVFPNPVKSKATIQHLPNTVFNISIFDLTGMQVEQKQIRGGEPAEWDFSNYKAGIYMMILRSKTGAVQRLKVIKQRE